MYPKTLVKRCTYLFGFSGFLLVFGIAIICIRTFLYNSIISTISTLRPNSYTYNLWVKNPVPLTVKVYLFNWTNPKDVYNSSIKPIFQELGPYFFHENKDKVNITWNKNNNTITYYHLRKWWFDPSRSNGSLYDPVTSVNPVALSSGFTAKDWNFLIKNGLNIVLRSVKTNVSGTHSVREILFDGYQDPMLTMLNKMPLIGPAGMRQFDKFGWFYTRNNSETYEGQYSMDTGVAGQIGELHTWKFKQYTPYYPEQCGKVSGSAGEFFPKNLRKDSVIKLFNADLCRFVELEFEKEVVIKGILGYKFEAADRFLDNGTKIPENKCFCKGDCQPYGALDISACKYGAPSYVSLPHFHKADPQYTSLIEGVQSNNETHDFFIVLEPKTGMPLQISARLQVNLLLQPIHGVTIFEHVPRAYIPVLWFEQSVLLPEDIIFYVTIIINLEVICLAVGSISIFLSILLNVCCYYKLYSTTFMKKERLSLTREEVPLTQKKDTGIQIRKKKIFR